MLKLKFKFYKGVFIEKSKLLFLTQHENVF